MLKKHLLSILILLYVSAFAQETPTVFEVARSGTLIQVTALFQENPKVVNAINEAGFSPLILACYRGNTEVAQFLIENGANLNFSTSMGTALMAAVVKNNSAIVKFLIQNKADIEQKDSNGVTALIYASMFKNHEITKVLMEANAKYETKDNRGKSALDYAILADDDQLIQLLKTQKK